MKKSWITVILVAAGAILLIISSGIEPKATGEKTLWYKIAGLILLMVGLFRASQVKGKVKEIQEEEALLEEEGALEEENFDYKIEESSKVKESEADEKD